MLKGSRWPGLAVKFIVWTIALSPVYYCYSCKKPAASKDSSATPTETKVKGLDDKAKSNLQSSKPSATVPRKGYSSDEEYPDSEEPPMPAGTDESLGSDDGTDSAISTEAETAPAPKNYSCSIELNYTVGKGDPQNNAAALSNCLDPVDGVMELLKILDSQIPSKATLTSILYRGLAPSHSVIDAKAKKGDTPSADPCDLNIVLTTLLAAKRLSTSMLDSMKLEEDPTTPACEASL